MLQVIDGKSERRRIQRTLERNLKTNLPRIGKRELGFRGGNETMDLYSKGENRLFFASHKTDSEKGIERYWNAFGLLDSKVNSQNIAVEINIAVDSTSRQVSAFFARDTITNREYLLHSGKIGGGHKGVGQYDFLAWSRKKIIASYDEDGRIYRNGFLVSRIDDSKLELRIEQFVNQVAEFKREVRQGTINASEISEIKEEIDRYDAEFVGRKQGRRASLEIDYLSIHGDIVDALMERRSSAKRDDETVANTKLIDLYVKRSGRFSEIYEIKPTLERYSLYTAIGQLVVHGNVSEKPALYLVIPVDEQIPEDIQNALINFDISVMRFSRDASGAYIFL